MLEPTGIKLSSRERVIFDEIIEERDPAHWTEHRVRIAAFLARDMHMVIEGQRSLGRHGFITRNGRGNPVVHPLARIVDQGIARICAYRRTLAIHARALGGEARDIGRRRAIHIRHERSAVRDPDNLIAFPSLKQEPCRD